MRFVLRGDGDGNLLGSLAYPMILGGPMILADFDGNGRVDVDVIERFDDTVRWRVYHNRLR